MENNLEKLVYEWITAEPKNADIQSEYYCRTRDVFQARLEKMTREILEIKNLGEDYIYIISAIAGEIGNNSFDHNLGNWPDIAGIFFGYRLDNGKLKVALADRGRGVLTTLKKVRVELKDDAEALKVAFTEKISGRAPENRGNGLKFVRENIVDKKMHLVFISGNGKIELNENMKIEIRDDNIQGCLAILSP